MDNMTKTIRLYGQLGSKFGRVHRFAVASPAEAVRALCSQLRGFEAFLTNSKDMGLGYAVFVGKRNLTREDLDMPAGNNEIRFAPVILGAKRGGLFNIILGTVLILVGTFLTPVSAGFSLALVQIGWSMVIGGVIQLLTPVPKGNAAKDKAENTASYTFNGPLNTQAQGNIVQVFYGENFVGSAVVSAGIKPVDVLIPHVGQGNGGGGIEWNGTWLPLETP